jgi:predicted metalloprotease
MKRLAVLFLVFGITAAACGDDSGSPLLTSTTTTGQATTTTIGGGEAYPSEMVEAYMDGCRPDGGEDLCRCTIDQYQARLTLQEFIDYTANTADIGNDPLAQDIIEFCTREGGTTATTVAGGDFVPFADMDGVIDASLADLNVYWAATMQEVWGIDYQPPTVNGPYYNSRGDQPTCGGPMDPSGYIGNAFYCGFDDTVQWDHEDLMAPLYEQFGDFTVALVLAHEWGHAIQNRYGFDESNPTIVSELQADCFAGSWTGRVAANESDILRLEPGDLEEAMSGFLLIGDQLGGDPGDDNAHGGSFDRLNAFYDGFNSGAAQCATYETDPPAVVFIPLEPTDDPTQGGDLAYDETAPLLIDALETFWGIVYPDVFGGPWVPVSNTIPYDPNGEVPSCGGFTGQPGFYEGNAFYCAADDFVAWDNVNLFPGLYTDIGDFAIGLVLADEWGRAVQTRAGLTTEGPEAQLQVDCMAGVWTAALVPADNPTGIRLSAGDLEEGISGFLSLSATPGVEGEVSAFQRFEAFKSGFFDGITVCGIA